MHYIYGKMIRQHKGSIDSKIQGFVWSGLIIWGESKNSSIMHYVYKDKQTKT